MARLATGLPPLRGGLPFHPSERVTTRVARLYRAPLLAHVSDPAQLCKLVGWLASRSLAPMPVIA